MEALLLLPSHNDGLATSKARRQFLWTYGPTALLTGLAAMWARTEYQTKLVAPWLRLVLPAEPASGTLLFDYVSPLVPVVIVGSCRRKDYAVLFATSVSLIFKLLIILSTGLTSLSPTAVHRDSLTMGLTNQFIDDNTGLSTNSTLGPDTTLAWLYMSAATDALTLPEGLSSDYVFQSVQTKQTDTAETRVTVDGLTNSLDCTSADVNLLPNSTVSDSKLLVRLNITSPGCNVSAVAVDNMPWTPGTNWTASMRFKVVRCDGIAGDAGMRVFVVFGNVTVGWELDGSSAHSTVKAIERSAQLLCIPTYTIHPVEVTRNSTHTISVEPVEGGFNRTLSNVAALDIMEAQFDSSVSVIIDNSSISMGDTPIYAVNAGSALDDYILKYPGSPIIQGQKAEALLDEAFLQQTATDYYRQAGAIVAKYALLGPTLQNTTGSATVYENRLIVSFWVAQSMAILAGICALIILFVFLNIPDGGFLPYNPSTLIGMACLSRYSHALLDHLRCVGTASEKQMALLLKPYTFQSELVSDGTMNQVQFCIAEAQESGTQDEGNEELAHLAPGTFRPCQPIVIHPVVRISLCLAMAGLVIALELLLHKCNSEQGIADVSEGRYIHYMWTAVPAIVFSLLATLVSAVDFSIRSLAPYMKLEQSVARQAFSQLDFLDMTTPVAMYKEMRLGAPWALATTAAVLIASLYTTILASLFEMSSIPTTAIVSLRANQSFPSVLTTDMHIPSLILIGNYSLPRYTYQNLAFPQLVFDTDLSTIPHFNESAANITAVVPALRVKIDCVSYSSASITTNITNSDGPHLLFTINTEESMPSDEFYLSLDGNPIYFGTTAVISNDLVAIWGKMNYSTNVGPVVEHIGGLSCNSTLEAVDTIATFIGAGFDLDSQKLPQTNESTARDISISGWSVVFDAIETQIYTDLTYSVRSQNMDSFFSMLVTSPWAVPISDLGDPTAADSIRTAIQTQVGIIHAQILNQNLGPANEANATIIGTTSTSDSDADPRYNATATVANGRRRLVQYGASTHALAAMLGVTLVLFLVGWATSPRTDVLPRPPTTISSAMALLAGGNLPEQLPADAQQRTLEEVTAALGNAETRIRMGWGALSHDPRLDSAGVED